MESISQFKFVNLILRRIVSFLLLLLFTGFSSGYAYAQFTDVQIVKVVADSEQREALIKSAYILNFTRYITWPSESAEQPSSGLRLCMISDEYFAGVVRKMAGSRTDQSGRLEVVTGKTLHDCGHYDLVYLQSPDPAHSEDIIKSVKGRGVLTIGESEHFLESGGMIRIIVVKNTVQFEVNVRAVEESGLIISSNMLRVAWRTVK